MASRDEEGDDASVGVPDQMGAVGEQRSELFRLLLEVDPLERWVRRVAAAVRDDEVVPLRERLQRAPGRRPVADAPVHEDDSHDADASTKSRRNRSTEPLSAVTSSTPVWYARADGAQSPRVV